MKYLIISQTLVAIIFSLAQPSSLLAASNSAVVEQNHSTTNHNGISYSDPFFSQTFDELQPKIQVAAKYGIKLPAPKVKAPKAPKPPKAPSKPVSQSAPYDVIPSGGRPIDGQYTAPPSKPSPYDAAPSGGRTIDDQYTAPPSKPAIYDDAPQLRPDQRPNKPAPPGYGQVPIQPNKRAPSGYGQVPIQPNKRAPSGYGRVPTAAEGSSSGSKLNVYDDAPPRVQRSNQYVELQLKPKRPSVAPRVLKYTAGTVVAGGVLVGVGTGVYQGLVLGGVIEPIQ